MWFKVTINKDGSVASCEQVAQSFDNGKTVRYVEADSNEEALRLVMAWRRARDLANIKSGARYREMKERGVCVGCEEKVPVAGRIRCQGCLDTETARYHERTAGERPRLPQLDAAERADNFRERIREKGARWMERHGNSYRFAKCVARRETLAETLEKLNSVGPVEFREWLEGELGRAMTEKPPQRRSAWRGAAE